MLRVLQNRERTLDWVGRAKSTAGEEAAAVATDQQLGVVRALMHQAKEPQNAWPSRMPELPPTAVGAGTRVVLRVPKYAERLHS